MKREKPLILLSNDDGVEAKGLNELIRGLRGVGEMIVMAPDGPRSGASGAITSEHPVRYYKVREEEDLTVYKCTGTPVDCVKLALHTVVPRRPDVVIGGINHGDNSSVNVHYSGTMGVVIEGCLKGISAIGYSLCNHFADADFSSSLPYIRRITEQVLEHGLPLGICLKATGGNFSKIFDVQNKKFITVSCTRCGYTELYKQETDAGWNILDFFIGN